MMNVELYQPRERVRRHSAQHIYSPAPTMSTMSTISTMPTVFGAVYTMPEAPKGPRQPHDKAAQDAVGAPSPDTQQTLVLVAEDEETIAETLALIVEDIGYVAIVAHDGREALALARQHHPHLIITDLMMPYLDGAGLIAAVRDDATIQGYAPPPVMVVTAASRARAAEIGADAIIPKPFDVTRIEEVMRQLLDENTLRK